ncbi:hypothetical protein KSF_026970 [Reticulibacter mediterranei]|uniref:Uncharacterized protein n=1 Tax=Reticulibacter mediterranei TaxID=2778369 RepID=A0A8J3MZ16_9CHLR|nr:hypothetical protein KSF_026970 [Reticulibacter mediterranei]
MDALPHTCMNRYLLLNYLNCRRLLLSQDEGVSGLYSALCDVSPEFYVHLLAEVALDATRKRGVLIQLLQDPAVCGIGYRSLRSSLCRVPARRGRRAIQNYRSYTRRYLLPSLDGYGVSPQMAAIKKQYVMRLLRYALGEQAWFTHDGSPARGMPESEAIEQKQHEHCTWYAIGRYRAGA